MRRLWQRASAVSTLLLIDRSPAPTLVRFWRKVVKTDTCWLFTARSRNGFGHGRFYVPGRGMVVASRYSWEIHNGPIPDGLFVLHHCDNPPCVRPDHLFVGTKKDNNTDMWAKGRGSHDTGGRGERNNTARLTDGDVRDIRRRHEGGEGVVALSRSYGVHRETIGRIFRGTTWTHIK